MKIHLSVYELWFWRIGIVLALLFSWINYTDNRSQDHLIFKSIDSIETTQTQISGLLEFAARENEINMNFLKIINKDK